MSAVKIDFSAMVEQATKNQERQRPCCRADSIIIDANNLLYRLAHMEAKDPQRVARVFMEKALMLSNWYGSIPQWTHVVWEGDSKNNWRFEYHPEYKATRKVSGDPDLRACVRASELIVREFLSYTVFPQWDPVRSEGDDGFATLARMTAEKLPGSSIGIYSTDRDLLQLSCMENVLLIVPQRGAPDIAMGRADVVEKFGVTPEQLLDVKALEGDAGDNIPGVKGIGKKFATAIVQNFGNFNCLVEALEEGALDQRENETNKDYRERLKKNGLTETRLGHIKRDLELAKMSFTVGAIRHDVQLDRIGKKEPKDLTEEFSFITSSDYLNRYHENFLLEEKK